MKKHVVLSGLMGGLVLVRAAVAAPLLEFLFNETGTQAPSSGTLASPLQMTDYGGAPADDHSAAGTGITAQPGDRAFELHDATGMGEGFTGGKGAVANTNVLDELRSFTICGWLQPYEPLQLRARIVDGSNYGVWAQNAVAAKDLHLQVNTSGIETAGDTFRDVSNWVFFAVVFDGTAAGDNMFIYRGTTRTAVQVVNQNARPETQVWQSDAPWLVGNDASGGFPFKGLLDNLRLYGSKTDGSGALSAAEIEAIRVADGAVPEYPMLAEFKFNEPDGYVCSNTGSTTTEAEMRWASSAADVTGVLSNLHTASGGGASGFAGDRAFDNRGTDKMGNGATNCGWAQQVSEDNELDNLKSFTMQGWFNAVTKIDANPGIFLNQSGGYGYSLAGNRSTTQGSLLLGVGDGTAYSTNTPANSFADTNTWVFFAATFDGPDAGDNVKFYKGTKTTPVTLVHQGRIPVETTAGELQPLRLGEQYVSGAHRAFRGLLDNMRIFGSKLDSSGVLTQDELEQFRQDDITEPTTIAVVPNVLNFGDVMLDKAVTSGVFVINIGAATLTGSVSNVVTPFDIASGSPYSIAAGATGEVRVAFAPTAEGHYTNTVTLSGGGGATLRLIGIGVPEPALLAGLGMLAWLLRRR